ncbi:hypothetical protein MKQ70_32050 [Chitinophaga sedimenti]|uniref:hypothetical protein n=1 Tax=Chitinophaga sedimenti TaxID=2033606 RepID=UPI00200315B2|nr:hypothetical protein [Chitinophaga sedimenti]MCK7559351.1 hypothetical protein [Chitinophaga sedimenti]
MTYHGSRIPTSFGSLNNTFSFKNISLTALIAYRFGYYFRANSIDYNVLVRQGVGHSDYYNRWQKPGDEKITNIPSFRYPVNTSATTFYTFSSPLVEKGDNIRLQFVHLNYEMNRQTLKALPFQKINLYVNISDIGIIWRANKKGIDPDNQGIKTPTRYAGGLNFTL